MTWRSEDIASSTKRQATKTVQWTDSRLWNTVFSTHSLQASEPSHIYPQCFYPSQGDFQSVLSLNHLFPIQRL